MKFKALQTIIMLSKYFVYGVFVQVLLMNLLFAEKTSAQKAVSVKEVDIAIEFKNSNVKDLFKTVEKLTDFNIHYDRVELGDKLKKNISLASGSMKVSDLLIEISRQVDVKFKQVNQVVSVMNLSKGQSTDFEVLSVQLKADVEISGKVTDENGQGLPGASVVQKGTTNGVTSDLDGDYKLTVPEDATLTFSFIGYTVEEVDIAGRTTIDLQMNPAVTSLDNVVVVGYAVQKKISLTNSVSQVSGEDITRRPVANIAQSLQGAAPGVFVIDNGGRPGGTDVDIRFRGLTTLGNNGPLIIVDGIEQRLSDINPDDIESVSLLKDASSTAIYGSRAANGVVLVTTKRAKEGDFNIDYHGYFGVQRAINKPKHLNMRSYFELENVARANAGRAPFKTEAEIDEHVNATDREQFPIPFPWFEGDAILKNAPQQNHTLSFSGGNEFARTRASIRHQFIDGIIPNTSDQRNEVRVNSDLKLSEKMNLSFDLNFREGKTEEPGTGVNTVFQFMGHASKFSVPQYPTGEYGLGPQNNNPLLFAELSGLRTSKNDYFAGRIKGDYEIIPGLKYILDFGIRNSATRLTRFNNSYRNEDPITGRVRAVNVNSLFERRDSFREYTLSHFLNYEKSIGTNNFNILLGYQTVDNDQNRLEASRVDFFNNDIQTIGAGSNDNLGNGGFNSEFGLRSYFGRLNYNYNEKYLVELNARYDGSSRFSSAKRFAFFPSTLSAAWRISEESFWDNLSESVNELKIRASWGETGNQAISLYQFFPALTSINYAFNESAAQGFAQTQFNSEDLTWEVTEQWDLGIDASLMNDKINFTFDYYDKLTQDILLALPIPATVGLNASVQNAGVVSNKGWEVSASYRGGDELKFNIGVHFSRNKNNVEDLFETGPFISSGGENQTTIIEEGLPINSLWGYRTDGFFQSDAEVQEYPTLQSNTQPGDTKYVDLNEDGVINGDDRTRLGNSFPVNTYGATMNFSYKGFELFLQWQGSSGFSRMVEGAFGHQATFEAFTHEQFADYWTEDNRDARWPRPIKSNLRNLQASDLKVISSDYLRLKNIMLSYNFNSNMLSELPINSAKIYVNATNVLTFSELTDWDLDPELLSTRGNYYPQVGLYTVGLKLNF